MSFVRKYLVLFMVAIGSFNALASVNNGDFELWTGGVPDSWETIDTGISVSQSNSIVQSENFSAAISVNTASQASTDLRQTVEVESGQSYEFSVWVYHTEGGVRARLYVDGYRGYSSPQVVNQWQQISYSYVANSTGSIEVGLRFYDNSSFDGSETVYVDNFKPSDDIVSPPPIDGCQNTEVLIQLTTDSYAAETSWQIKDSNQATIASRSDFSNNSSSQTDLCLAADEYSFTIFDSYGDGICCAYGLGKYEIFVDGTSVVSGGEFASSETKVFVVSDDDNSEPPPSTGGYYDSITNQVGYALKDALHQIIKSHTARGYSAIWDFYAEHSLDTHYENDGTILDIYSENPNGADSYSYQARTDQCGSYNSEADCYNREHSFPRSWFGGSIEPMNSDIHHIFASDGYVNSKRGSYPFGEVASASFISANGSQLGSSSSSGFSGTVFEPIDEFKGDLARAYFYMATRYQDNIVSWHNISTHGDSVLNGTSDQVFETWQLNLLISWHNADPVSQKEIQRNQAAFEYQGNRNPFVDHPEWVEMIWVQ